MGGAALLHSASHDSTDDPLLGEDVDDEDRGHGHQVAGEGHRVVGGELRAEDVLGERDGLVRLIGQNDQRQEEVVPGPQRGQDGDGGVNRAHQREDDGPEDAPGGCAIDAGSFFQRYRNRTDEAGGDEQVRAQAEHRVQNDQADLVVQVQGAHLLRNRQHDDRERHEHGGDEEVVQEAAMADTLDLPIADVARGTRNTTRVVYGV